MELQYAEVCSIWGVTSINNLQNLARYTNLKFERQNITFNQQKPKGDPMKKMIVLFTIVFSLSLFAADKTKMVTLNVSGMTCESCAGTVEKALKKVSGVKEVKVDLKNNKAIVTLASATTSATLIKAVSDAGFSANEGKAPAKKEMKKQTMSESEECGDGCCGDDCGTDAKPTKAKKTEAKKS